MVKTDWPVDRDTLISYNNAVFELVQKVKAESALAELALLADQVEKLWAAMPHPEMVEPEYIESEPDAETHYRAVARADFEGDLTTIWDMLDENQWYGNLALKAAWIQMERTWE